LALQRNVGEVSAMKKIFRTLLGFGLLLICTRPLFGQSMAVAVSTPEIVVHVNDYVQLSQETLTRAEEVTSGILRKAGVEVVWVNCNFGITAEQREPECARLLSALDLVVNLVDRIQPLSPNVRVIAMGAAMVPSGGGNGDLAYLSIHQATSIADESSVPLETLLGLGAAHELGHLLLGENAHTSSGLMKARWSQHELALGSHEKLLFTAAQSDRIRRNLLARQKEASTSVIATKVGAGAGLGL
jgi:hypothetical protein